jgi:hypothetical protein
MSVLYRPDNWATARCRRCCDACWSCLTRPTSVSVSNTVGGIQSDDVQIPEFGEAFGGVSTFPDYTEATYDPFDPIPDWVSTNAASRINPTYRAYGKGFGPMWPNYSEEFFEDRSGFGPYRPPIHPFPYEQNQSFFGDSTELPHVNPLKSPFVGRADCAAMFFHDLGNSQIVIINDTSSGEILFAAREVYVQIAIGYGLSSSESVFNGPLYGPPFPPHRQAPPALTKSSADRAASGVNSKRVTVRFWQTFTYSNTNPLFYGGLLSTFAFEDGIARYWRCETHYADLPDPHRNFTGTIDLSPYSGIGGPFVSAGLEWNGEYDEDDYGGFLDTSNRYEISVTF